MIDESLREIMKEPRFELFLVDFDHYLYYDKPLEMGRTKYRVTVAIRNVNSNLHYSVSVKSLSEDRFMSKNGWTLKEIWFQSDWNNYDWPSLTVVDPNGDELHPKIPFILQREIEEYIPNWRADEETVLNRITEGLRIFQEVTCYPDKKRYLLINDYSKVYANNVLKLDFEKWGKRLVEVHESKADFTDEQLKYFLDLYAQQLREYFETKERKTTK